MTKSITNTKLAVATLALLGAGGLAFLLAPPPDLGFINEEGLLCGAVDGTIELQEFCRLSREGNPKYLRASFQCYDGQTLVTEDDTGRCREEPWFRARAAEACANSCQPPLPDVPRSYLNDEGLKCGINSGRVVEKCVARGQYKGFSAKCQDGYQIDESFGGTCLSSTVLSKHMAVACQDHCQIQPTLLLRLDNNTPDFQHDSYVLSNADNQRLARIALTAQDGPVTVTQISLVFIGDNAESQVQNTFRTIELYSDPGLGAQSLVGSAVLAERNIGQGVNPVVDVPLQGFPLRVGQTQYIYVVGDTNSAFFGPPWAKDNYDFHVELANEIAVPIELIHHQGRVGAAGQAKVVVENTRSPGRLLMAARPIWTVEQGSRNLEEGPQEFFRLRTSRETFEVNSQGEHGILSVGTGMRVRVRASGLQPENITDLQFCGQPEEGREECDDDILISNFNFRETSDGFDAFLAWRRNDYIYMPASYVGGNPAWLTDDDPEKEFYIRGTIADLPEGSNASLQFYLTDLNSSRLISYLEFDAAPDGWSDFLNENGAYVEPIGIRVYGASRPIEFPQYNGFLFQRGQ